MEIFLAMAFVFTVAYQLGKASEEKDEHSEAYYEGYGEYYD